MHPNTSASGSADSFAELDLRPEHQALIEASSIEPAIARQRGYRSVRTKVELDRLGYSRSQQNVPALLIPLWDVHGEQTGYQIRPDTPRKDSDGDPIKYESPIRSRLVLDVPPVCRDRLRDREIALWITEGSRKADSAASRGLCCISLQGVWGWKDKNGPLSAWDEILLPERTVYLAFDNDILSKPAVHKALSRLKGFLEGRRAAVLVVVLPPLPVTGGAQ